MNEITESFRAANRILLTTHVVPDGDGLGSQAALALYLKRLGKTVTVLNTDALPDKFAFLSELVSYSVFDPTSAWPESDLIVVVDTNELKMLGNMAQAVSNSNAKLFFIDHHTPPQELEHPGYISEEYESTGELVFEFFQKTGTSIDEKMANALYVALLTDSSSFRFRGTTARFHEVAATLIRLGAKSNWIERQVYSRDSVEKLRLMGLVLSQIQVAADGRVVWIEIPKKLREEHGATIEDTESFINHLTLMDRAEIVLLIREEENGRVKVSFRGLSNTPVLGLARKLGGGGHEYAAGTRITGNLADVTQEVIGNTKKWLEHPS